MSRKKSGVTILIEYVSARAFGWVMGALPIWLGMQLAAVLGTIVFCVDRRHRLVAYDNLRRAFGDTLSRREIRRITLRNYIHMLRMAVDMIHLPRLHRAGRLWRHIEMKNMKYVEEAVKVGKGGIFVTGHVGNWELIGWVFAAVGYNFNSLARPLDNPLLDEYMRRLREGTGQKIVRKERGLRTLARVLREGGYAAFLIDQDARGKGVFVEFFGREASTTPAVAALALRTGAPIITGFSKRVGGGLRYELTVTPPIWPESRGDRAEDIKRITSEMTRRVESAVRACPEQWMWLHRRWKTRPAEKGKSQESPKEKEARSER